MLNRQKVVIYVLRQLGGSTSRLKLMKLLFLLGEESQSKGGSSFFEFLPYRHGPYSFTLAHEASTLANNGYSEERGANWLLTDIGQSSVLNLGQSIRLDAMAITSYYGSLALDDLVKKVYARYPWYTAMADNSDLRAASLPHAPLAVYTMGYEGLSVDGFLEKLLRVGIKRIVDVRRNPLSRRYGFHGRTLGGLAGAVSIEYQHLPELGIASDRRRGLTSTDDYDALFYWYRT